MECFISEILVLNYSITSTAFEYLNGQREKLLKHLNVFTNFAQDYYKIFIQTA